MKRWILFFCLLFMFSTNVNASSPAYAQDATCSKASPPRLKAGTQASVVTALVKDFPGGMLKVDADRISPVLRYLPLGTVVDVVEGPTCGKDGNNWYKVRLAGLTGYMQEAGDGRYGLATFTGDAPPALPSTIISVLDCIGFNPALPTATPIIPTPIPTAMPVTPQKDTPAATVDAATIPTVVPPTSIPTETPNPTVAPTGNEITRVIFATSDGNLQVSDNGDVPRVVTRFDPAPLAVDLSPDGSAAAVATYNGLYWVDLTSGSIVLVADAKKFGLSEGGWISQVKWLPDGHFISVEITESQNGVVSYAVWTVPIDGTFIPYRIDVGAQSVGGIIRSPKYDRVVVLSTNDIIPYPISPSQDVHAYLEYVPRISEGENGVATLPTLSWNYNETGFYTYIPISTEAPPDDPMGGHIWFVTLKGVLVDLGKPNLNPIDYAIVSSDGQAFVVGRGTTWTIRKVSDGSIVQKLPPVQLLFGWTPDGKGIIYRDQAGNTAYLGVDGGTDSPYVPSLSGLYDIKWLSNGSPLYLAQGKDKKLSLSIKPVDKDPVFMGIVNTVSDYSGRILPQKPGAGVAPQGCK